MLSGSTVPFEVMMPPRERSVAAAVLSNVRRRRTRSWEETELSKALLANDTIGEVRMVGVDAAVQHSDVYAGALYARRVYLVGADERDLLLSERKTSTLRSTLRTSG